MNCDTHEWTGNILMLPDELLCGASTFLNFKYSSCGDDLGPHPYKTPVDNRYYIAARYIPDNFSGTTLWTPLPCFPPNTLPYVLAFVWHVK